MLYIENSVSQSAINHNQSLSPKTILMSMTEMRNSISLMKAIFAIGLLIFLAWGCEAPQEVQEHLVLDNVSPFPEAAITSISSMEEFNDYLKQHGHDENEIQQFLKEADMEDLFTGHELDTRSNCSCSDDATFSVSRIGDLYIVNTLISPSEPEVRLFVDQYNCDGTTISSSFDIPVGSLDPCYHGSQVTGIDWSSAACGCVEPRLYDLHFELRRVGTWAYDCDHQFYYGVECID